MGGANPLTASADPALLDLWRALQQDAANLPPPVNALVAQIAQHAGGSVSSDATSELEKLYQEEVVAQCRVRVEGRYPFGSGSDMPLADFGDVFGYGGAVRQVLHRQPRQAGRHVAASVGLASGVGEPSAGMLAQFERAERIRQMFFSPGSKMPELGFTVRLSNLDPPATRFYVNIDGQSLEIKPGAESRSPVAWPGPDKQRRSPSPRSRTRRGA